MSTHDEIEQQITEIIAASDDAMNERRVLRVQVDALYEQMEPMSGIIHHACDEVILLIESRLRLEHPGWDQSKSSQAYKVHRLAVREAFERVYHAKLRKGRSIWQFDAAEEDEEQAPGNSES